MQTDLEMFHKQRGDEAGGMMQNLRAVNREKYDYTAFLKKFAVMGEAMRINDDEFDYVFYSYGMQLFPEKRMPLIEPLEYKDVKRIREFVIAIDTSGSVMGEQVQAFLQKTYNILQSTESFFSHINVHIIQCDEAGGMIQNLRAVNREKYDYTAFLKKFAVMGEAMRINDDEFDYVFYSYGMQLFPEKRMPLIEPLEYKDVKRIREFVIAIDTSGSVMGEQVQAFLQKTYNILQSTESFFSRINVHIIQCDEDIQEDIKITLREEFDHYLQTMAIEGLGGTDFRPVFQRVDEMIRDGEFANLKGLIYFTDGYGLFLERMPAYKTAFVFVEDGCEIPEVPVWAMKLVLTREEVEEMAESTNK